MEATLKNIFIMFGCARISLAVYGIKRIYFLMPSSVPNILESQKTGWSSVGAFHRSYLSTYVGKTKGIVTVKLLIPNGSVSWSPWMICTGRSRGVTICISFSSPELSWESRSLWPKGWSTDQHVCNLWEIVRNIASEAPHPRLAELDSGSWIRSPGDS